MAQSAVFTARTIVRFLVLAGLFGPVIVGFPVWYMTERAIINSDDPDAVPRLWWVRWLVWALETSGPTFIKLGQWASSRADLFPPYVCEALSRLQANVTPHSLEHTSRMIEDAFGATIEELFVRFDTTPIGCGAIAQVHYAELRSRQALVAHTDATGAAELGMPCAVKVLHPGVRDKILVDLAIMTFGARVITAIVRDAEWLSLPEEVGMFGSMMKAQLDLTNEARNLHIFKSNFRSWSSVGFPTPIEGMAAPNVLVENYLDALPMAKFLRLGGDGFDKRLAQIGLTTFLKMLILDNHVHADLHPGNMLVTFHKRVLRRTSIEDLEFVEHDRLEDLRNAQTREEWTKALRSLDEDDYVPFLYVIDTGLVSTLSQAHLRNFLDLFQAITEFNGNRISQLMISRSRTPWTVVDPDGFTDSMTGFIRHIKDQTFALKNIRVADILGFVLSTVRRHHVKIEGDFANVAVSIMLLEGMGRQLEPSMDLLKASVPFLRLAIASRLEGVVSNNEVTMWRALRKSAAEMVLGRWFGPQPARGGDGGAGDGDVDNDVELQNLEI
ncbi:hypothetical protein HK105_206179 [Polyrhizophydium stewartii]|uniref:ABC1 atypical kinase-like domain-containing protein n=1 Tax=Polyrhizophydium stewartii TaxID=2732419 RepID=A0ABR4N3Y1_9FUNG